MASRKGAGAPTGQATTQPKGETKFDQPENSGRDKNAKPGKVNVTLNVRVPENAVGVGQNVYLAGTLKAIGKRGDEWDAKGQKMKRIDNTRWTLTLTAPENTEIEYKYTLGDWEHVELDQYCSDVPNRRLIVLPSMGLEEIVDDIVYGFRSVRGC
jgi:hypothetical protein